MINHNRRGLQALVSTIVLDSMAFSKYSSDYAMVIQDAPGS
jgi:hypothetical protein